MITQIVEAENWEVNLEGKLVAIKASFTSKYMMDIPAKLRDYVVEQQEGQYRVNGFFLARVLEHHDNGNLTAIFLDTREECHIHPDELIRHLLDDEGLPSMINGLPFLDVATDLHELVS